MAGLDTYAAFDGKERLSGISKQGDPFLHRLLVTGATCVIRDTRRKAPGEGGGVKALLRPPEQGSG
jgi:transposase